MIIYKQELHVDTGLDIAAAIDQHADAESELEVYIEFHADLSIELRECLEQHVDAEAEFHLVVEMHVDAEGELEVTNEYHADAEINSAIIIEQHADVESTIAANLEQHADAGGDIAAQVNQWIDSEIVFFFKEECYFGSEYVLALTPNFEQHVDAGTKLENASVVNNIDASYVFEDMLTVDLSAHCEVVFAVGGEYHCRATVRFATTPVSVPDIVNPIVLPSQITWSSPNEGELCYLTNDRTWDKAIANGTIDEADSVGTYYASAQICVAGGVNILFVNGLTPIAGASAILSTTLGKATIVGSGIDEPGSGEFFKPIGEIYDTTDYSSDKLCKVIFLPVEGPYEV